MVHTPGPWQQGEEEADNCISDADGVPIAAASPCDYSGRSQEETSANARLIAAAPDLLSALMEAVDNAAGHFMAWDPGENCEVPWMQRARAAIAAATHPTP